MKNNNRKIKKKLLALSIVFILLLSYSPIFNNLFINPNPSAIVERDVDTDFDVFQNMAYIYSGMFYDDTDTTFAWTTAKIEFEHTDALYTDENGEWDVTEDFANSESKSPSGEENLVMTDGTYSDFNNMSANDDDYARFNSTELGHFPATYSFDDQPVGTKDTDIDYVDAVYGGEAEIIAEYQGHKKVLHYNSSIAANFQSYIDGVQTSGTVEFYLKAIVSRDYWFLHDENSIYSVLLLIYPTFVRFFYGNGAGASTYATYTYDDATFPHFKIEFDYETDRYSGWCEGVLIVNNVPFYNDRDDCDYAGKVQHYNSGAFEFYYDAEGRSWDSEYNLGDNLNDNYYLGYDPFESYNQTTIGDYSGTESFDYNTEEGVYYGTYDFRDDTIDGNPAGWDIVETGGTINVIAEKDEHKKVLEFHDTSITQAISATNDFTLQTDGTIEFWWAFWANVTYTNYLYIRFYEGGVERIRTIYSYTGIGQIQNHNGSVYEPIEVGLSIDTFYHIKYVFNDTTNTFNYYINGVDYGVFNYFTNSIAGLDRVIMLTRSNGKDYYHWIDAMSYSGDTTSHGGLGYTVGWNINPYDIVPLLEEGYDLSFAYDTSVQIVNEFEGHNNVLKTYDDTNSGTASAKIYFTSTSDPIVEFWAYTNNTSYSTLVIETVGSFGFYGNNFRFWNGTVWEILVYNVPINNWHHLKFIADTDGDLFDVYINGTLEVDDYSSSVGSSTCVYFYHSTGSSGIALYIDGFGVDGVGGYEEGDNINPYGQDVIDELEAEGWVIDNDVFADVGISGEFSSHKKFLNLTDDTTTGLVQIYNEFSSGQTSGTYELYVRFSALERFYWNGRNQANQQSIYMWFNTGHVYWYDGVDSFDIGDIVIDTWYHFKVVFDCDTDTYDVYQDRVLIKAGATFAIVATTIDKISLNTHDEDTAYSVYIDAISYFWEEPTQYFRGSYNQHCNVEAVLDFTIIVPFTYYERFILQVNVSGRYFTSTYTNVTWLFYNFTSSSWVQINDSSSLVEVNNEYVDSDVVNGMNGLFDSNGNVKFRFYCFNSSAFYLNIDELTTNIYFGTQFEYELTIEGLGAWRYRFKLDVGLGTEYIQDWIYFDVIESTASKTVYKDKPYTFELHDFFDSEDRYHKYTSADFQAGLSPASLIDYPVDPFYENYETEFGDPDNIIVETGTSNYADHMQILDTDYTLWTSSAGSTSTHDLYADVLITNFGWGFATPARIASIDDLPSTADEIADYMIFSLNSFTLPLGTASGIQVYAYARQTYAGGPVPGGSYRIGAGAFSGVQTYPVSTTYGWHAATYSGLSLSQADVNDLQFRISIPSEGSGTGYVMVDMVLVRITYEIVAPELSTEISMQFTDADVLDDKLSLKVSSTHRTNIATTLDCEIYNFDTTNWETIHSGSATSFTERTFSTTSYSDYLNSTNHVRLKYSGTNALQFQLHVDYLWAELYAKLDLEYTMTFTEVGVYIYRWEVTGSLYYTNYVLFEVIEPPFNFYAISESDLTTRWILQDNELSPVENFHDNISADYWNLVDVSDVYFKKLVVDSSGYLLDNSSYTGEVEYTGTHFDTSSEDVDVGGITWDGEYFWIVGFTNKRAYKYTSAGVYTGTSFNLGGQTSLPWGIEFDGTNFWVVGLTNQRVYKYTDVGVFVSSFDVSGEETNPYGIEFDGTNLWVIGTGSDTAYKYTTAGVYTETSFSVSSEDWQPYGITWDGYNFWVDGGQHAQIYQYTSAGVYTGIYFDIRDEDVLPCEIEWDGENFWVSGEENIEVYKYSNTYNHSKNYFGDGYMYMQTNATELISLKSQDYGTHYNLSSGDYLEVDFQTSSDSKIELILLKDGGVNKTLTLSGFGNTNFIRHTVQISIDEFIEFDQLKISSIFEDKDNVKIYDIKTYKYEIAGDYADFYVGSGRDYEVYLTPDVYNLRISERGVDKVNENITIPATGVRQYVYTPTELLECRIALFSLVEEYLQFEDYHVNVNRSLNGVYGDFELLEPIFLADEGTYVYIDVSDRFDALIDSFERLSSDYMDLYIEVYSLKIRNEATEIVDYTLQNIDTRSSKSGTLFSDEIVEYHVKSGNYSLDYINYEDMYPRECNFELTTHKTISINSTYNTIYIGLFTYDGLGLNRDWMRLYINDVRSDFGFNVIQSETANLTVLDYFNNTLESVIIDASAYSEYNLYAQVYSMYILNQFTYSDLIFNITQVGSGMWMNQLIPASSALLYRFIPNINYTIKATYVNGTVYSIRTVNLTDNSQIEDFGVPSAPSEYPKDVYFGVYTTTGLGIDRDLLRFYIDGNRTDFGFNRITDMIITLVVKDYFNTTLFNQMVNTSGIYEYNILITLYSLKVKNEARVSANYTLKLGGLETTGYILPEEIIEYQLSSNNYVFDYTNNEDNSFHTININLNQDRVYVLNSTYYDTYFSLYDQNGVRLDDSLFSLYLNGTRKDFGFVELESTDVLVVVQDYLNFTVFNSIITLSDFTEYNIIVTVFELQIRHLSQRNSNLTLYETTTHNHINFSMSPDSLNKYVLSDSTYNITWVNGENGLTTVYDITLDENYILTLNTTYYSIFFNLYDVNLHIINPYQYEFRLNGTIQDFGSIIDLQTDDYNITVIDRFGTYLFNSIVNLRSLNEYRIDISLHELQISHLARYNSNLTLTEDISGNDYLFIMVPYSIKSIVVGSADYTLGWTNGENGLTTSISIALTEDRVVMLNTSYYNTYFSLYDVNLHIINPYQYEFRLNGTIQDFGLIVDLSTDDYNITVIDRFGTYLFNSIVNLRGLNEYRIDISLYELQISHLARYNSNLTLTEDILGNDYLFIMVPYSIKSIVVGSADYTLGWTNGENGLTTSISIALTEDRVVMLNTSYYNIRFNLFDLNLHTIDLNQYEFRLNGTIEDFGLIVDLQTDDYSISVVDRFGTYLFNSIVNLRGLNEYRIDISLYELQIRHLARVNGNLTLSETTTHNYFEFIMSPNSLQSFILGSSTYNITWLNNENGITTTYDFTLNTDYILTLNTSYYNIHFSLFDLNLHSIYPSQYEFKLNGTIQDFGLIVDLQTDDYSISVVDRFGISLFNSIITLRGLNEYRIDITLYELQISHLARVNGNLTLSETTTHNYFEFIMSPNSLRSFILGSSTYNITWLNNENGITTTYDFTLNTDYILTLNTSYYNIHFSLFDLNLHSIYPSQYEFRLNGTIQDFNKIIELQTDDYNITVVDRFGVGLFNNIITLRGLNGYRIDISLYEIQIIHLARENSNLTLTENVFGANYSFIMAPNLIKSIIVGSADYTLGWTNGENGLTTLISIALTEDRVVMLNTSYYNIRFNLFDVNLHTIDPYQYVFRLNGTIEDFDLIEDLSTDDYNITVIDRFGTYLFNSIVNLRGLNEYRIDITLYELQIKHLATENSNLTLYETTSHNGLNFSMAPDSLRSFILGSSTYNITWLNNENGITTTYNINLNLDYILTLDTTYYDTYFSLYDQGGVRLDDSLFSLYVNTTRKDFGFVKLESNSTLIVVQDYLNVTVFNQVVGLGSLAEYNIIITVFELQIRHLAFENSNLTLYETTTHNHINFSMSPDSLNKYVLSNSTYNITWLNGENLVSTLYNITLDENYILLLDTTYYDVYIGLYNFYGVVNSEEVRFYVNDTRADFGFNTIKSEYVTLTVLDYFNSTLYDQTVRLEGLSEYSIFIQAYTLVVNNLYNNQSITIEMTRGTITIERLIEAQGWTEFKLFANATYEIISYVDGTLDEEKEVDLDEEYKTVDFGFYEEEIPDIPDFNAPGIWLMIVLILMGCGSAITLVGYLAYRYRKKSENYRRAYADKITLEAQTIKKFSQGTRIR